MFRLVGLLTGLGILMGFILDAIGVGVKYVFFFMLIYCIVSVVFVTRRYFSEFRVKRVDFTPYRQGI
jgi:Na+-transporting methylmalonyl-CoA/oxaloacetate decarboxylase gamma subunit